MNRIIFAFSLMLAGLAAAQDNLRPSLETTYSAWREAMIRRDVSVWQRVTAEHRRIEVRNRITSEKQPFPATVFNLPAPPPSLNGLKFLEAKQNGATAKASYFGKVDFGVGGEPTENLLVLSFVKGNGGWLYDRADFVNLTALAAVRKELAAGDLKYLKETPEAQPSGVVPPTPIAANPAKYVAKVYVFCPGREVQVQINKISRHRFANAKEAEIVIGGAQEGPNEVQYSTKKLDGGTGKEVMTIRVYLMSEVAGAKPVKAFEYQLAAGEAAKPFGTGTFNLDAATAAKLVGR
ncbi:MAG: hypothetical protein V4584_11635 [Verrucomicrobiota bacterium]